MGIKVFFTSLLVFSITAYFVSVDNLTSNKNNNDIPLVVFEDSIMYTLTDENLNRVIESSYAVRYKNRDEMINGNILLKNTKTDDFKAENIKAKKIIKKGELLTLKNDVQYTRDDFVDLKTQLLYYSLNTRIAHNSVPYEGNYLGHFIKGEKLFFDAKLKNMSSENVHFEIDMKNKN